MFNERRGFGAESPKPRRRSSDGSGGVPPGCAEGAGALSHNASNRHIFGTITAAVTFAQPKKPPVSHKGPTRVRVYIYVYINIRYGSIH